MLNVFLMHMFKSPVLKVTTDLECILTFGNNEVS